MKTNPSPLTCWLAIAGIALGTSSLAAAGDPALPGYHPLTQPQAGDVLLAELRCTACHAGIERQSLPEKSAPDLAEVGSRMSPAFLRKFLASPAAAHPGTTMPDVLAARPAAERDEIALALTHFLVAQSKSSFIAKQPTQADRELGKSLFHAVGCVACHGPHEVLAESPPPNPLAEWEEDDPRVQARKAIQPIAVPLAQVAAKYSVQSLGEFLFQPLRVRGSGRMPDLKLTPAEALAIASYLIGDQARPEPALVPQDALVAKGGQYFRELNCAACHALPGIQAAPLVGSLTEANLSRGCSTQKSGRGPRFSLSEAQIAAIAAALRDKSPADSEPLVVAKTMTVFRCVACHVRDDYGGVADTYSPYFTGSEQKLGDDGRIPPPLTLVGAKLQPAWLKKVLFDGETVRHYMATRMPQYGVANLGHLPPLLARLDVFAGPAMNLPGPERRTESERASEKQIRAAGRELLGDTGLNCVACHMFNGKAAPGSQGIDLITTTQRLEPDWFNAYVRNPGAFRPRTVMPSAWSGGVAAHKTILDGDTDRQIAAIWYYLSLGTSAADPPGIRAVSTKLTVENEARTYRGRSRVAGFRGIAVGLPEKLSYAFNAETGALTAIWRGDFLNANWSGQGSGDFQPASEPITLAQDVSFARLADEDAPWPLLPVMTKEAKTNPDPLYPKNLGYQFRGYFFGESAIPTLQYRFGTIEIEDRSVAAGTAEHPILKRMMQLESPAKQEVWFRALTGDIRPEGDRVYRVGKLRLTIPDTAATLRKLSTEPPRSELLLHLTVPQGQSSLELRYEPLDP
ncbi:MAG: c-type cytochrome [Pirellulaceae bacterium]|nr:c-type cytochrome [Pirellulaceae bacterium]